MSPPTTTTIPFDPPSSVEPGSTVAVIGCGGVGLSCINGAAIAGAARIIAVDTVPSKLDLARKFGATDVVNAGDGDPIEAVRELTGGIYFGKKSRTHDSATDVCTYTRPEIERVLRIAV